MAFADNRDKYYCPWLDKSPTSLRTIDSHNIPQQRTIPRSVKKLIDGDLAALNGSECSTRDRLKEKLRRKHKFEGQMIQESQTQVMSAPTDLEQNKGQRKKRRKKLKKASTQLENKNEIESDAARTFECTEKVTDAKSRKVVDGKSYTSANDIAHGDVSALRYNREKPPQRHTVTRLLRTRLLSVQCSCIAANLYQKLTRYLAVEQCMFETMNRVARKKRDVKRLNDEMTLLPNEIVEKLRQLWIQSRKLSAAAPQKLSENRAATFTPQLTQTCLGITKKKETKERIRLAKILVLLQRLLDELPPSKKGYLVHGFLSTLQRMIAVNTEFDYTLQAALQAVQQIHIVTSKVRIYPSLTNTKQNVLLPKKMNICPRSRQSLLLEMKQNCYLITEDTVTVKHILSDIVIKRNQKFVLMDTSVAQRRCADMMLIIQNDKKQALLVITAVLPAVNQANMSTKELSAISNVPKSLHMAYIGHHQLVTSELFTKPVLCGCYNALNKCTMANRLSDVNTCLAKKVLAVQPIRIFDQNISCPISIVSGCTLPDTTANFCLANIREWLVLRGALLVVDYTELSKSIHIVKTGNATQNFSQVKRPLMQLNRIYPSRAIKAQLTTAEILKMNLKEKKCALNLLSGIERGIFNAKVSKATTFKERMDAKAEYYIRKENASETENSLPITRRAGTNAAYVYKENKQMKVLSKEKSAYLRETEQLITTQTKHFFDNIHIEHRRKEVQLDTCITFGRQTIYGPANRNTAKNAARRFIVRPHEQMLGQSYVEHSVQLHNRQHTFPSDLKNSQNQASHLRTLFNADKQKQHIPQDPRDIIINTGWEVNNQTVETMSVQTDSHTPNRVSHSELPGQQSEHSEVKEISEDIEQTHHGIRLCLFD